MSKTVVFALENHALAVVSIRNQLYRHLQSQGYAVHILTGRSEDFDRAQQQGLSMIDVGEADNHPLRAWRYMQRVHKAIQTLHPKVILTFTIRPAVFGNLVAQYRKVPTITNITGIGPLFIDQSLTYRVARGLYRIALRHPSIVFFQNADDRELFQQKMNLSGIDVRQIPGSGINTAQYQPRPDTSSNEKFVFLMISRLIRDKGIVEYVDAARILRQRGLQVTCRLLGPYWTKNLNHLTIQPHEVNQWVDEGIIEYQPPVKDVRDHMAACDAFVLPSYREGTSNVLLEAAAMERPIVTTNVTGCKEIVLHEVNGLLCRPRDAEDLAEKMADMVALSREERQAMGRAGRAWVHKHFNKTVVLDAYVRAIQTVLEK